VVPWYVSFDSVRGPAGLGRGRPGRDVAVWIGGTAAALVLVLAGLVGVPLWSLGPLAPRGWSSVNPPGRSGADTRIQLVGVVRPFALPPDSTITPLEAGNALHSLEMMGAVRPSVDGLFRERPLPAQIPALPQLRDSALFPLAGHWPGPDERRILPLALRGFTPAQLNWLEAFAAHPAWAAFSKAARAADLGARFVLPFPVEATADAMPIHRFSALKSMAYANAVRAALYLAQGRRDEAERVLKETVSFGLHLVDRGRFPIDLYLGSALVGIGRDALVQYYTLTGRPEGPALKEATTAVRTRSDSADTGNGAAAARQDRPSAGELRRTNLYVPRDPAEPLPLRFGSLYFASQVSCSNLREMLFGPAEDVSGVFAYARRDLARFPSDSALIDLMERDARQGPSPSALDVGTSEPGLLRVAARRTLRVAGSLLGNPRLTRCALALL
jgi:hypothetical protein